jgi:hypothetical protein
MTNGTQNKITGVNAENVSFIFPRSEEIVIHKSDLQIQLEKFKKRIYSSFYVFDLLAVVSLWSPVFSADFKQFLGLTSNELRVGYIVFAVFITLFILVPRCSYFISQIWNKESVSPESEKMVEKILQRCQSKPKNTK